MIIAVDGTDSFDVSLKHNFIAFLFKNNCFNDTLISCMTFPQHFV